ncbi:hypothetical protein [Stenotrophomonas phage RAS14]
MTDKIVWSGKTSSYHHKWNDTPNPDDVNAGFREVFYLDAQWSTCPIEVEDEVRKMWDEYELGNDCYIIHSSLEKLVKQDKYHATIQYITEQKPDIDPKALILIHWWW